MTKTSENQRNIHSLAILSADQRRLSFFSVTFKIQRFFQQFSDDFHFSLLFSRYQQSHESFHFHRRKRTINDFIFHLLHSFVFVIFKLFRADHFYILFVFVTSTSFSCSSFLRSFVFVISTFFRIRHLFTTIMLEFVSSCSQRVVKQMYCITSSFYCWTVKDDYMTYISQCTQFRFLDFAFFFVDYSISSVLKWVKLRHFTYFIWYILHRLIIYVFFN